MPKMILVDVKAIAERRKARETAFMEMLTDEQCMAYKGLREFRRDKESYVNDYDKSASEVLDFMYYLRDLCTTPSPKTGTISLSKTEQQPMSWKNLAQTSLSDALVKHRVALEALDGIHPLIDWKPIEQQMSGIHAKKQGEQALAAAVDVQGLAAAKKQATTARRPVLTGIRRLSTSMRTASSRPLTTPRATNTTRSPWKSC